MGLNIFIDTLYPSFHYYAPPLMKIFTMSDTFEIADCDSVDEIKQQIFHKYRIPLDSQIIYARGGKHCLFYTKNTTVETAPIESVGERRAFVDNEKAILIKQLLGQGRNKEVMAELRDEAFNKCVVSNIREYLDVIFSEDSG